MSNKHTIPRKVNYIELEAFELMSQRSQRKLGIEFLTRYMYTYDEQYNYENYNDSTVLEDVLYGLGVAIGGDKHLFSNGFETFLKNVLIPHLKERHPDAFEPKE